MPSDMTSEMTSGEPAPGPGPGVPHRGSGCWRRPTSCSTPTACIRVGIDRVIERADVARASLYSTFGSKDELIRAYLEHRMDDHEGPAAGRRRGARRSARGAC